MGKTFNIIFISTHNILYFEGNVKKKRAAARLFVKDL